MLKKTLIAAGCLLALGSAWAAGVRVQTVESQGVGATREEAVRAALAEAVARVAGVQLSAQDAVHTVSDEIHAETTEKAASVTFRSQEKVQQQVQTATRGTVRSYQVISVVPEGKEHKLLRARLSVDVNYFQPGQETERLRIAVLPFKVHRKDVDNLELGKLLLKLNQSMVSYFTGTRHFAVLDRDFLDQRLDELASLMRPDVRLEERARVGNTLAADYIVTGLVTDFDYSNRVETVPFTNERIKVARGNVGIQWRVIEASTGQIVVSDTISQPLRSEASFSNGGMALGERIAATVTGQIYPLAAIAFEDGRFLLAQGGVTLHVGDRYQLVRQGKIRIDPYTKEQIGRDEILVGEVRISRVSPKMSYAEIVQCSEDPRGMGPREYLLRPMESDQPQGKKGVRPAKTMQPQW